MRRVCLLCAIILDKYIHLLRNTLFNLLTRAYLEANVDVKNVNKN